MLITIKLSTKATAKRVSEYIVGANPFTTDYLVILMNESGKVMQGTIGQVTPSKSRNTTGSSELIKSILQKNPTDFNGAFMMLTLDRVFLYQFEYENFKRTKEYSVRSVTKKEEATIKSNSLQNTASYPKQNDIKRQDE
ncbi:MAG: hypothetical protein Q8J87_02125, partial [Sediminibacterium sp.]|nr:hypothetical protein [Sediminibacterium sp.]